MIFYKNTNVKVCSPDGDTGIFDIVAGILQGDSFAPYQFIICRTLNVDRSIGRKWLYAKKKKKQTIPHPNYYGHRLRRWHRTSSKYTYPSESLMHSLEKAPGGIGLHVNEDKTKYMCFNKKRDISTLIGSFLKLVDKFTYLGSSVSSTENDINMQQAKAWTAIDWLSIIWKSDYPMK